MSILQKRVGMMRKMAGTRKVTGEKILARGRGPFDLAFGRMPESGKQAVIAALMDASKKNKWNIIDIAWKVTRSGNGIAIHVYDPTPIEVH